MFISTGFLIYWNTFFPLNIIPNYTNVANVFLVFYLFQLQYSEKYEYFWHLWLWYLFIVYQWSNIKLFELQTKAQVFLCNTSECILFIYRIFSHAWCINLQRQTTSINNIIILIFIYHIMCFTLPHSVVFNFSALLFLSNHFVHNFDEMLEYLFIIFSCN